MTRAFIRGASVAALLSLLAPSVTAQSSATATTPLKAIETLGCYSSADPLTLKIDYTYQTSGYCQQECASQGSLVMAITEGSTCYCGNEIPAESAEVSGDNCNTPCNGFDQQFCGGAGYWQVYLTGLGDADTAGSSSSSGDASTTTTGGSSSTSAQPSVITKAGQTIVVTASATSDASSSSKGGGSTSKVGVAVGVVVGLLAVAGIIGGIILLLKRRRRLAIEEEHRRNAAVSGFVSGGKSQSETSSSNDQRLDPSVFSHRRQSIGSIADERDFSRRILQVRNPDRDSKQSNMA